MREYDVCIIGAGSVGTATAFILSRYTNVRRIIILDKENGIAKVASSRDTNSQTLHPCGIELNYTKDKTEDILKASGMVKDYARTFGRGFEILKPVNAMVLAIEDEISYLEKRFDDVIKPSFPKSSLIDRKEIGKLEPRVVKGRNAEERIEAINSKGYIVDFGELSKSFIENTKSADGKEITVKLGEPVDRIEKFSDGYNVKARSQEPFLARYLVISAGTYTHHLARQIGLGGYYIVFPVYGNFFTSKPMVSGKVYRVQKEGVPFASVHADRDWEGYTRYGPTASLTAGFEKGRRDIMEYVSNIDTSLLRTAASERKMMEVLYRNITYSLPGGRRLFWRNEVGRIVPSLRYEDLKPSNTIGGVRTIPIDRRTGKPELSEKSLVGENVIGNLTPSPGASGCLGIAYKNTKEIAKVLGLEFDDDKFEEVFRNPPHV